MEAALAEVAVDKKDLSCLPEQRIARLEETKLLPSLAFALVIKNGLEAFVDVRELKVGAKSFDAFGNDGFWILVNDKFVANVLRFSISALIILPAIGRPIFFSRSSLYLMVSSK